MKFRIIRQLFLVLTLMSFKAHAQQHHDKSTHMDATKITLQQAEELSSNFKHKAIAPKVVKYLKAEKGYILKKDQRVIIYYKDSDIQIIPFADFYAIVLEIDKLLINDPQPEQIFANVEANIETFKQLFQVSPEKFNYSFEILEHVDKIYSKLEAAGISEAEMFYPLVSFCGELLVRQTKGSWQVRKNSAGKPTPVVIGEDGKEYDPYNSIQRILINVHKPYSFQIAIKSQLEENKLRAADPPNNIPLDKIILKDGKPLSEIINKKQDDL